jgi:predicted nucleic acid-binding Zn ribbon protein
MVRRAACRVEHPLRERPCVVCGKPMRKRPDALVCSPSCREERRKAQRRELDRLRRVA